MYRCLRNEACLHINWQSVCEFVYCFSHFVFLRRFVCSLLCGIPWNLSKIHRAFYSIALTNIFIYLNFECHLYFLSDLSTHLFRFADRFVDRIDGRCKGSNKNGSAISANVLSIGSQGLYTCNSVHLPRALRHPRTIALSVNEVIHLHASMFLLLFFPPYFE